MNWCFAIVNRRLAELFFEKEKRGTKIIGHAYVQESEYTTKKEKLWIQEDTAKFRFSYRNKKYRDINDILPIISRHW